MKKLFSGIKWFEDTLTSAFLSIVVLITLAMVWTSLWQSFPRNTPLFLSVLFIS